MKRIGKYEDRLTFSICALLIFWYLNLICSYYVKSILNIHLPSGKENLVFICAHGLLANVETNMVIREIKILSSLLSTHCFTGLADISFAMVYHYNLLNWYFHSHTHLRPLRLIRHVHLQATELLFSLVQEKNLPYLGFFLPWHLGTYFN